MNRQIFAILLCVASYTPVLAQWTKCRLFFIDKEGSSYCQLSNRALQRRERQGIALDESDKVVSPQYLSNLKSLGYTICTSSRWLNTVVVGKEDGSEVDSAELVSLSYVQKVQPVQSKLATTNAAAQRLWEARRITVSKNQEENTEFDNFRTPVYEVNGDALYEAGYRGQNMLITMLDGGYTNASSYPQLYNKVVGWSNLYMPNDSIELFTTSSNHGTQCLSLMATDSIYGVWGTAPEATYYLVRTEIPASESPFEEDLWVAGAELADSLGSDLLTASLGYYMFDDARFNHSAQELIDGTSFISQGAAKATTKGMLVVVSAGNEGLATSRWGTISFPGNVAEVLTVGATDSLLQASKFSSPGWLSPYVKPDVACRGTYAYILSAATGQVAQGDGTSYAAPFMCGLMASLWSAEPSLLPEQLRSVVQQSASQTNHPDIYQGYGMPDFAQALTLAHELAGVDNLPIVSKRNSLNISAQYYDLQGRPIRYDNAKDLQNCHFMLQKGGKISIVRP